MPYATVKTIQKILSYQNKADCYPKAAFVDTPNTTDTPDTPYTAVSSMPWLWMFEGN